VENPNRSRDVVRINLAKCFPEMDPAERERLVGQALKDIGKSFVESACAWIWPPQRSLELVKEVHLKCWSRPWPQGVVGITSHLGNWEVLNHFYCSQCKPIIFYRPPKLKAVDDCCASSACRWATAWRLRPRKASSA
jgi:KDO2-lipid IV(A) lauroyltransferase